MADRIESARNSATLECARLDMIEALADVSRTTERLNAAVICLKLDQAEAADLSGE